MVKVDQNKCISCGTCINICPEVFVLNDEGKAEVQPEDKSSIKKHSKEIEEAIENCPVSAISNNS